MTNNHSYRIERDPLGEKRVPAEALFGVQTLRGKEAFQISKLRMHPGLFTAFAEIKCAAAEANLQNKQLDKDIGDAIITVANEIISGKWRDQFDLDVFQAGAGTSYNMNVNEVIANRALELLGAERGDHERVNPNDHVNKSQSTNDTMPTAMRIAAIRLLRKLLTSLDSLAESFDKKGEEFKKVKKSGRTHLHDAVPMTLGDEFVAYAANVRRAIDRLEAAEEPLLEIPLGGTAIGTGVNTKPRYKELAVEHLQRITELPLRESDNPVPLTHSLSDFVALSANLRCLAVELSKIANDLRLLNSGPHTGFNEIELPATQPGSSIMPGKVNPAVAEMLNMVCFHVIGQDTAITMCGEAGQLELNVMMPYVAYALLESLEVMEAAVRTFDEKCVRVIRAHQEQCAEYAERTVGKAALHNEELGFMGASELANKAIETGKSVDEVLAEEEK
ncbi:MAG TPA: aspartate ammonia-lyase [Pyrinomonadaceae bacterium]|nr:aspartate ammonia-lyase [Pyrinomonadaceae bacterium]